MKTIEFINSKGDIIQWNNFTSMSAAKRALRYVKANFSKNAKIVEV